MDADALRRELSETRRQLAAGDRGAALASLDLAIRAIEPDKWVTLDEAAALLGFDSVATVRWWCQTGQLPYCHRGSDLLVSLDDIARWRGSEQVRAVQIADAIHTASADLGSDQGLTDAEGEALERARPGRSPWTVNPLEAG